VGRIKFSQSSEIGAESSCNATTRGRTNKWRLQAYSACETDIEQYSQKFLTVVESGGSGGNQILAIFKNRRRLSL